ncbi:MAG: lytic transglycosylase domain-containing protein [Thermoleophilaceae bacterium]|nr:lytic transglycosylase domain-containing protein [Thermoleophilaceae bacterium]
MSRAAAGVAGLVALLMVLAAAVLAADDPPPRPLEGSDPLSAIDSRGPSPWSPPSPREPVSRRPDRLATALETTTRKLDAAIDSWVATDTARGAPPREVTLLALYQQRIYLVLGSRPRLAAAVVRRLNGGTRAAARDVLAARRALGELNPPTTRVRFSTGPSLPAGRLLRLYRQAERRFGVSWELLAAVNLVETGFNKIRSNSTAGAQGPMQFIPSTWAAYGMGGNIRDPRDAIMGAANYLHASGAPRDDRRALFAYNPSSLYVTSVQSYARRMRLDPRAFYGFYSWQIFVSTPSGSRRLTGPGIVKK